MCLRVVLRKSIAYNRFIIDPQWGQWSDLSAESGRTGLSNPRSLFTSSYGFYAMSLRNQCILGLILFAVIDAIIPIPFAELILLYILMKKPDWFREMVDRIYSGP